MWVENTKNGKYKAYQSKAVKASTYRRNGFACDAFIKILGADVLVERLTANYIKDCFIRSGKLSSTLNNTGGGLDMKTVQ